MIGGLKNKIKYKNYKGKKERKKERKSASMVENMMIFMTGKSDGGQGEGERKKDIGEYSILGLW